MTDELTPSQPLALWGLLARQGRAPEAEVQPKADRDVLIARGFAEADKPSKTVSLTNRGWRWADTSSEAHTSLTMIDRLLTPDSLGDGIPYHLRS